jgi:hypothetical protein
MLATEFARRDLGVRVNAICPGFFASGMSVIDPQTPRGEDHYRQAWGIPAARPGNALDYAQCIISTAKNQYMTGAHVVVDGGWLLDTGVLCEFAFLWHGARCMGLAPTDSVLSGFRQIKEMRTKSCLRTCYDCVHQDCWLAAACVLTY